MNDDGPEDEKHFPHAGTTDGHILFAFFEEALLEFLKHWYVSYPKKGIHVENLTKSAGRTSAHV